MNFTWARTMVDELVRGGVREVVVCPGSRSGPLAIACAEALPVRTVVDERSAAFFALGAAKASGRPAVVIATSGTAGAHFYPAILEAEAAGVPLIALTADRPPELHGWGAPQTMDQQHLFGRHVRFFADVGLPELASLRHLRALVARAVDLAADGPVHLNAPFREPLAPVREEGSVPDVAPAARIHRARGVPDVRGVARELSSRPRGVIVAGLRDA
ncbi:MAG: 2-succinyl-5-enolpyruvyl-6-hydroxy-3-cyclohexene-1-carboxylic-acid synthase, partial [Deltaproteobacteria bacterium]